MFSGNIQQMWVILILCCESSKIDFKKQKSDFKGIEILFEEKKSKSKSISKYGKNEAFVFS
jgi:hypothetical protein